jgi:hypothetical protein
MIRIKRLAQQFVSFPFIGAHRAKVQLSACRRQVEEAGVWFVDIPRTGSTSLKLALASKFGKEFGKEYLRESDVRTAKVIPDHATARQVRNILSFELWSRLLTFTVVRNPWDRCHSLFRYRIARGDIPTDFSFLSYLRLLERHNTRSIYSPYCYNPYFIPMCDFILDEENRQLVTFVGRFEKWDELATFLQDKFNLELPATPRAEVIGFPGSYKRAYCSEGVEIIARIYRDDIERFRYDF